MHGAHDPQRAGSVFRFASQPFAGFPSQSAKPVLHENPQVPVEHVASAFAGAVHALPQRPHAAVLPDSEVSQPLDRVPSQSPKPGLQLAITHAPLAQSSTAFAKLQTVPHVPQFVSETFVLVSQPFAVMPSQFAKPVLHTPSLHALATHVAPAFGNEQEFPHPPQLLAFVVVLVSQPGTIESQSPRPAGHMPVAHMPPLQIAPAPGHTVPQAPQLVALMLTLVSQPLAAMPSQLAYPGSHAPSMHVPMLHDAAARANVHRVPQAPQFRIVSRLVSQPSLATPLQLSNPAAHVLHVPSVPQPRLPTAQSASPQHPRQPMPVQQFKPAAQPPCVHVPAIEHASDVHASSSLQSVALQQAAHRPPQSRRPDAQRHRPIVQTCPAPHALPQPPQFALELPRSTSQPSVAVLLQSANPESHTHTAGVIPLQRCPARHAVLHAPQWEASVSRSAHAMPQRVSPVGHPLLHAGDMPVAMVQSDVAPEHTVPHVPQFIGSSGGVHAPPQRMLPGTHSHVPAVHCSVAPHARPHVPQCVSVVRRSTSQPLLAIMSQSPKPVSQPQTPAVHAWFVPQRVMQSPQCVGSMLVLTSQPFAGLPSQSAVPIGHTHEPPVHTRPIGHARPHAPQFIVSVPASTSQPSNTFMLQSRNPRRQMFVHEPPTQVVPGHAVAQSPQCRKSRSVSAHVLPQQICPVGHVPHPASAGPSVDESPSVGAPSVVSTFTSSLSLPPSLVSPGSASASAASIEEPSAPDASRGRSRAASRCEMSKSSAQPPAPSVARNHIAQASEENRPGRIIERLLPNLRPRCRRCGQRRRLEDYTNPGDLTAATGRASFSSGF